MSADEELDALILSLAKTRWQKVAMIVGKAYEQPQVGDVDDPAGKVAERIEHLVKAGRLESQGDLSRWRHSEIRLPDSSG